MDVIIRMVPDLFAWTFVANPRIIFVNEHLAELARAHLYDFLPPTLRFEGLHTFIFPLCREYVVIGPDNFAALVELTQPDTEFAHVGGMIASGVFEVNHESRLSGPVFIMAYNPGLITNYNMVVIEGMTLPAGEAICVHSFWGGKFILDH